MIRTARVAVGPNGRLDDLVSGPPLTIRRVHSERPDTCALAIVGSAAGPLAGDVVHLEIEVAAGARVTVTATGAALAQGRGGGASEVAVHLRVAAGAEVTATLPPLIVCAGAAVITTTTLDLDATATVVLRETLVLGRSAEPAGRVRSEWTVTRDGAPLLRQTLDLTDPDAVAWPGLLAENTLMATALVVRPGWRARTRVLDPTAVAQRIAPDAELITVLDRDAAAAERRMATLLASGTAPQPTGAGPVPGSTLGNPVANR